MNEVPLIITGSIAVDRIATFDGDYLTHIKPDNLHSLSVSILLDELRDTRGGVAANIAYSIAMLGEKPLLFGSVGADAEEYISSLTSLGIDTQNIHVSDKPTGSFTVIGDSVGHQIGGFYPGAMFDSGALSLEKWKDSQPFVVIAPHDPKMMKQQVAECKKYGFRLLYDVGQQANNIDAEDIIEGIEAAELLIVNDFELQVIVTKTGLSAEELKSKIPVLVTTLGEDGSVIEGKNVPEAINVGSVKPDKIVDLTGAGDAYRAGFLYQYLHGSDLEKCARYGAVCAAYAIEHLGTQEHNFNKDEVELRYEHNFN